MYRIIVALDIEASSIEDAYSKTHEKMKQIQEIRMKVFSCQS